MASNQLRSLDLRLKEARGRAWTQRGLLSADDLRAYGLLNRKAYQRLVERNLLVDFHRRVWRLPDARVTEWVEWTAATLWAPGAVLCLQTALKAWGIETPPDPAIHIATTRARSRSRGARPISVHRLRSLNEKQIVSLNGLRITSIERTLLDVADELAEEPLQWALEQAWRKQKLDPFAFLRRLDTHRRQGRKGIAILKALLSDAIRRRRPLESPLEIRTWRSMEKHGLPPPQVQVTLRDGNTKFRPDFLYEGERLIVEALGYEKHGTREAFEDDIARVGQLTAMGYTVFPISWRILEDREAEVMSWIRRSLEHRRVHRDSLIIVPAYLTPPPDPVTTAAPPLPPPEQLPLLSAAH